MSDRILVTVHVPVPLTAMDSLHRFVEDLLPARGYNERVMFRQVGDRFELFIAADGEAS